MFIIVHSKTGLPNVSATDDRDEAYDIFEQQIAEVERVGESVLFLNLWDPTGTELIVVDSYVYE